MMNSTMERTLSSQASDWREGRRLRAFELKERGAEAYGFRGEVWTCARVAEVIRTEFGVLYHPAHVSRLVRKLGLSLQKPVGRTPILHERLGRDHLSAMSAVTLDGRLYMIEQEKAFKGEDAVRFLKHLMRHIPGKLLVIWDGSPIHRAGAVKDFLAGGAAARVQLERLPGYAPDLNPDEGIWKHLKCVELKNLCCQSLAELKVELRKAKERLRHKRDVILGCIRQPGFEV